MEYSLDIDRDNGFFLITTDGEGTEEGMMAFMNEIVDNPSWRPGKSILLDHRRLSVKNIQFRGIETMSEHFVTIGDALGNGKIALVMNEDIDFGIARAWEMITVDQVDMKISVFRSIHEATSWLLDS